MSEITSSTTPEAKQKLPQKLHLK